MRHCEEGDSFKIENVSLLPIQTPGHMSDHLCFVVKEDGQKPHIFSGDHIVGATSTYFTDYPEYYDSLVKTQKLIEDQDIDQMFVAHSMSLYKKDVSLNAL